MKHLQPISKSWPRFRTGPVHTQDIFLRHTQRANKATLPATSASGGVAGGAAGEEPEDEEGVEGMCELGVRVGTPDPEEED